MRKNSFAGNILDNSEITPLERATMQAVTSLWNGRTSEYTITIELPHDADELFILRLYRLKEAGATIDERSLRHFVVYFDACTPSTPSTVGAQAYSIVRSFISRTLGR